MKRFLANIANTYFSICMKCDWEQIVWIGKELVAYFASTVILP